MNCQLSELETVHNVKNYSVHCTLLFRCLGNPDELIGACGVFFLLCFSSLLHGKLRKCYCVVIEYHVCDRSCW